MFLSLFIKECKQHFKSITYYVFLACMLIFYFSQMSFDVIEEPKPGQSSYSGTRYSDDEAYIMERTVTYLIYEYSNNTYGTYPIGFYKEVKLNEKEQKAILAIIEEITGLNEEEVNKAAEIVVPWSNTISYSQDGLMTETKEPVTVKALETVTYSKFLELMDQVEDLLGSGSKYDRDRVKNNAEIPMDYEAAKAHYDSVIQEDRITNAYARQFCDYLGIIVSLLPVFLAAARTLKDRRAQADSVIYMKKADSATIIVTRYLSAVAVILLPVLALGVMVTAQCAYFGSSIGASVDIFALVAHIFGWLLPTILVSLSVGFFFTELLGGASAILIQSIWWFISLFTSGNITGSIGYNLIPRFNSFGNRAIYLEVYSELIKNRILYALLGLLLLAATIVVYNAKRKGVMKSYGTLFKHRKSKSEIQSAS